eukprot:ctg_2847.g480
MTAVAAVAGCVDTAFEKYYESFMPPLKGLLRQSTGGDKRMRLMRGKTMECITLIGVAVGGDRFGADADEVMQILVENQRSMQFEPDDPQIGYMMQAYARICKSLGERFVPYLRLRDGGVWRQKDRHSHVGAGGPIHRHVDPVVVHVGPEGGAVPLPGTVDADHRGQSDVLVPGHVSTVRRQHHAGAGDLRQRPL